MNYGRIILLLLLFPASVFTQVDPIPQLITNEEDDYFGTIRWTLPEQEDAITDSPGAHLRVYTRTPEEAISEQWPPVMGGYEVRDHYLYFRPRFPFLTGRSYWVWYNGRVAELQVPEKETLPPPGILDVFPSGAVWPANQLKFYVYFDQPMRTGFAGDYLRLLDEKGNRVEAPFLDMGQELWDREQKRLTVWFDPGRIKSHLIPNQKMGPPLQANRTYQLVIKKGWPAANGEQLQEDHVKNFVTGGKDQEKPQPERWEIQAPVANTRESFILQFHEAMDMVPVGIYKQVGYKFNAWHDVGWWQVALPPPRGEISPPILTWALRFQPEARARNAT